MDKDPSLGPQIVIRTNGIVKHVAQVPRAFIAFNKYKRKNTEAIDILVRQL